MKRLKTILTLVSLMVCLAIPNVVFAYDDYCDVSFDGYHDFSCSTSMTVSHPHKGYLECFCGKRIKSNHLYNDECETCRRELCKKGLHYYLAQIHNEDMYSSYGECYCGKRKYFSYDTDHLKDEPYDGFMTFFGRLYSIEHPHYQYDIDTQRYDYEDTIRIGSCEACDYSIEYYDNLIKYETNLILYGEDEWYEDDEYHYDEMEYYDDYDDYEAHYYEDDYDDDYEVHYYEDDDYYDDQSEYYDEEDDFYEWLELAKKILAD